MSMPYQLNDRVTTTKTILLPSTTVDSGEIGTIVDIDDDGCLLILLDRHHPGLRRTRNHIAIFAECFDEIKLMRRAIRHRIAAYVPGALPTNIAAVCLLSALATTIV